MPELITFRVTAYNSYNLDGPASKDRVVARFDVKEKNLQEALTFAHQVARSWNREEHRPNMIVKHVAALGTVLDVIQPATIRNANRKVTT